MTGVAKFIGSACLAIMLTGCAATVRNHGYVPEDEDLATIIVGVDTQATVESAVGRPSASGVLEDQAWYYVRTRFRRVGPFAPKPVDRELVAISFATDGTVENIERFGLENGRVVPLSRRVTQTSIRNFGLVQQIVRNFGRINIGDTLADEN